MKRQFAFVVIVFLMGAVLCAKSAVGDTASDKTVKQRNIKSAVLKPLVNDVAAPKPNRLKVLIVAECGQGHLPRKLMRDPRVRAVRYDEKIGNMAPIPKLEELVESIRSKWKSAFEPVTVADKQTMREDALRTGADEIMHVELLCNYLLSASSDKVRPSAREPAGRTSVDRTPYDLGRVVSAIAVRYTVYTRKGRKLGSGMLTAHQAIQPIDGRNASDCNEMAVKLRTALIAKSFPHKPRKVDVGDEPKIIKAIEVSVSNRTPVTACGFVLSVPYGNRDVLVHSAEVLLPGERKYIKFTLDKGGGRAKMKWRRAAITGVQFKKKLQ